MVTAAGAAFLAKRIGYFILDHWKGLLFCALMLAGLLFGWNWYLDQKEARRRAEEALSQSGQIAIDKSKVNANVAENVANRSVNEANTARETDTNKYSNNWSETKRKYCANPKFKNDSVCQQ